MTSAVNPEFKFSSAADLKTLRFDKRPIDQIKAVLNVAQWQGLAKGELEVYKKELQEDVSEVTARNTPKPH